MIPPNLSKRVNYYFLLAILAFVSSTIMIFVLMISMGKYISYTLYPTLLSVVATHIVFSLICLKTKIILKIIIPIIVGVLNYAIIAYCYSIGSLDWYFKIFDSGWSYIVIHLIIAIILWEIVFYIFKRTFLKSK